MFEALGCIQKLRRNCATRDQAFHLDYKPPSEFLLTLPVAGMGHHVSGSLQEIFGVVAISKGSLFPRSGLIVMQDVM